MKTERLLIFGRVQGVGYRDWMVQEAARLGVAGWVRNLGQDRVEAVVCGEAPAVDAFVEQCRRGPLWARVTDVQRADHAPHTEPHFRRLPSA